MAIAVIKDDKVVMQKGYGIRELGKPEKATTLRFREVKPSRDVPQKGIGQPKSRIRQELGDRKGEKRNASLIVTFEWHPSKLGGVAV